MSCEVDVGVQTLPQIRLPPPPVTVAAGDLLSPRPGLLVVKPLELDGIYGTERIGVVPSTLTPSLSIATGASIPVLELKAKWEIPPPPDCAPPPPPFSNNSSPSWEPPIAPHDPSFQDTDPHFLPCSIPPPLPSPSPTDALGDSHAHTLGDIHAHTLGDTLACPDTSPSEGLPTCSVGDGDDADLTRQMKHSSSLLGGDEGLGDDEALIDDYEEEEDDDDSFTVHFVHHGRKQCEYTQNY